MSTQELYKWNVLLSQLEVILECTTGLSILQKQELKNSEAKLGFIFPQEYKEFCQVIGTGGFGQNRFYIECPEIENAEEYLESNRIIFDLRTYRQEDRSYDIYVISCYRGFHYYFGRDFFSFIQDFCIGEKAKTIHELPVEILADCDKKTFVPFPVSEEDFSLFEDV